MIQAAENVAQRYNISRNDQDAFALESHRKTIMAYKQKQLNQEIVSLEVKGEIFNRDESIKERMDERTLNRLKPLLTEGTVTAGNCCMKNDGAVLLLVMNKAMAEACGIQQGLTFKDGITVGVDPTLLGIGPVPAVNTLLKRNKHTIDELDAIELNEAFASQVLASQRELGISLNKLNIYGGAIASGHPYGASGAALVTRLFYMKDYYRTIATMGIGGGMGNGAIFERWS